MVEELKIKATEATTIATTATPRRVIIVNCFGRGGSSILWNMIGSSPDVIMTNLEWHEAFFGSARRLRKLVTRTFWYLGLCSIAPFQRRAHNALLAMRSKEDMRKKGKDKAIVTKVMGYHMVFNQMIGEGFDDVSYVVLTRHPYGQCESLMRSGLSLQDACNRYQDIAGAMAKTAKQNGCVVVRFEELVKKPVEFCDQLYSNLEISWRRDRHFLLKRKRYGESRQGDGDFSDNLFVWIGPENASQFIDSNVVESAVARLSRQNRSEIWRRVGAAATELGYAEDALALVEDYPRDPIKN